MLEKITASHRNRTQSASLAVQRLAYTESSKNFKGLMHSFLFFFFNFF